MYRMFSNLINFVAALTAFGLALLVLLTDWAPAPDDTAYFALMGCAIAFAAHVKERA